MQLILQMQVLILQRQQPQRVRQRAEGRGLMCRCQAWAWSLRNPGPLVQAFQRRIQAQQAARLMVGSRKALVQRK